MCREKAKAGGQRLQGVNQQRSKHISSQAGPRGSLVAVLIAMGSPEMFPVEMGVRVEAEGAGLTCPSSLWLQCGEMGPVGPSKCGTEVSHSAPSQRWESYDLGGEQRSRYCQEIRKSILISMCNRVF